MYMDGYIYVHIYIYIYAQVCNDRANIDISKRRSCTFACSAVVYTPYVLRSSGLPTATRPSLAPRL